MCNIIIFRMGSLRIAKKVVVVDPRRALFVDKNKEPDIETFISKSRSLYASMEPVKIPITPPRDVVFRNLMALSVCGSVVTFLAYIIFIKQPTGFDDIFKIPPEEFVALVDRDLLRRKIKRDKETGKDVTLMEAELDLMNSQIADIRSRQKKSNS